MNYFIVRVSMFSNKNMTKVKKFSNENQAMDYLAKMEETRTITQFEGEECRGGIPVDGYVVMSEEEFDREAAK